MKDADINLDISLDDLISRKNRRGGNFGKRKRGHNRRHNDDLAYRPAYKGQWSRSRSRSRSYERETKNAKKKLDYFSSEDELSDSMLGWTLDKISKVQKRRRFDNRRKRNDDRSVDLRRKQRKNVRRKMIYTAQDDFDGDISDMDKVDGIVIIVRGVPGSGKTTFARKISKTYGEENCVSLHLDSYFFSSGVSDQGVYNDEQTLEGARTSLLKELRQKMDQQKQLIVVDGVFAATREYREIREMAKTNTYGITILDIVTKTPRPSDLKIHLPIMDEELQKEKKSVKVEHNFEPWTKAKIAEILEIEPLDEEMEEDKVATDVDNCAFVTLVMRGTKYVLGAVTLAHSLRLTGTKAKLVCMITEDVQPAKEILDAVFDEVVFVPYIKCKCKPLRTEKQRNKYKSWIADAFTKWNCLNLTNYRKVLFLDADVVAIKNLDSLFALNAPAGTFSSPWARGKASGKDSGRAIPGVLVDHFKGPEEIFGHGKVIPWKSIESALKGNGFFAVATTILLEPNNNAFNALKEMLVEKQSEDGRGYGFENCYSGNDEQALAELYWKKFEPMKSSWTHIDPVYNFIPWHLKWINGDPKILHYHGKAVWDMERGAWPDCQVWWNIFESFFKSEHYSTEEKTQLQNLLDEHQQHHIQNRPKPQNFWCASKKEPSDNHVIDPDSGQLVCPLLNPNKEVVQYTTKTGAPLTSNSAETTMNDIDYGI